MTTLLLAEILLLGLTVLAAYHWGGAYRLAPVQTGYSDGFRTIVSGGLAEGDVVLVAQSETVR